MGPKKLLGFLSSNLLRELETSSLDSRENLLPSYQVNWHSKLKISATVLCSDISSSEFFTAGNVDPHPFVKPGRSIPPRALHQSLRSVLEVRPRGWMHRVCWSSPSCWTFEIQSLSILFRKKIQPFEGLPKVPWMGKRFFRAFLDNKKTQFSVEDFWTNLNQPFYHWLIQRGLKRDLVSNGSFLGQRFGHISFPREDAGSWTHRWHDIFQELKNLPTWQEPASWRCKQLASCKVFQGFQCRHPVPMPTPFG